MKSFLCRTVGLLYLIHQSVAQPSANPCSANWVHFQTSCYNFIDDAQEDWTESEYLCSLYGGKLVEIETAEENAFIKNEALKRHPGSTQVSYWIGGTDLANEGKFVWMKSQEPFDFTDWHPGNPSDSSHHEDCVHLWYDYHYKPPMAWNDIACERKFSFICEKQSVMPSEIIG